MRATGTIIIWGSLLIRLVNWMCLDSQPKLQTAISTIFILTNILGAAILLLSLIKIMPKLWDIACGDKYILIMKDSYKCKVSATDTTKLNNQIQQLQNEVL